MSHLLDRIDFFRFDAGRKLDPARKSALGQFLTPLPVARLMASMLTCKRSAVRILDAGAGVGTLFTAAVAELCRREARPESIAVTAYEIDAQLADYLADAFAICEAECRRVGARFAGEVVRGDFIAAAVESLATGLFRSSEPEPYDVAILNPPYRKIRTDSEERRQLQRLGIETSNLYTAFLALAVRLLGRGGELVAITPRSFCNGPYFRSFRRAFLSAMTLRRLHVFESREHAFRDDQVLQENLILQAVKGAGRDVVAITSSTGPDDELILTLEVDHERVVRADDPDGFIHIETDEVSRAVADQMATFRASLADLGLSVSTGRVVEFRARPFLRGQSVEGTAPLIHPAHFERGGITWPKVGSRRPNAIQVAEPTRDLLVPQGNYVLTRRFSAKEERRRLVATVFEEGRTPGDYVGFENHLNYFHRGGRGIDLELARGLAAYLNSTLVDAYFRQFNGHTQVNAADLRNLGYPEYDRLVALGVAVAAGLPPQAELDELIARELLPMAGAHGIDPIRAKQRTEEALGVLRALGLPRQQLNERSALTLLALLDLRPESPWSEASNPLRGITPMMEFFAAYYGKVYKPNTRETVRRQTVHQFLDAGLIVINPDDPARPVNSPKAVYQIEASALELLRTYGTASWESNLRAYLASAKALRERYAREREMARIPVKVARGKTIMLSPGGQNVLVKAIVEEFAALFTPGGRLLYVGDTDEKFAHFDAKRLADLGVRLDPHGKMPDVIIHHTARDWLVLVEAVTSHGPIDPKRRQELSRLFGDSRAGLVFVTAFLNRKAMIEYLDEISWETEVWVAESPTHLIHFNGERFLGPYPGPAQ